MTPPRPCALRYHHDPAPRHSSFSSSSFSRCGAWGSPRPHCNASCPRDIIARFRREPPPHTPDTLTHHTSLTSRTAPPLRPPPSRPGHSRHHAPLPRPRTVKIRSRSVTNRSRAAVTTRSRSITNRSRTVTDHFRAAVRTCSRTVANRPAPFTHGTDRSPVTAHSSLTHPRHAPDPSCHAAPRPLTHATGRTRPPKRHTAPKRR